MKLSTSLLSVLRLWSLPTWERGLKQAIQKWCILGVLVAPYVGAWIETTDGLYYEAYTIVAPYVGAWIETYGKEKGICVYQSLPTWERGLKRHASRLHVCINCRSLRGSVD